MENNEQVLYKELEDLGLKGMSSDDISLLLDGLHHRAIKNRDYGEINVDDRIELLIEYIWRQYDLTPYQQLKAIKTSPMVILEVDNPHETLPEPVISSALRENWNAIKHPTLEITPERARIALAGVHNAFENITWLAENDLLGPATRS